jgi:F0F1-type ATP synthase delta subunit
LNGALASRYAAALADVALEQKSAERVKADLYSFS